jgi:ABC-2 type transport system permease protein
MSKIGLIIGREYTSRVKKKSFIVMTLGVPLLVVAFLIAVIYLGMPEEKKFNVLVVDETIVMSQHIFYKQDTNKDSKSTVDPNFKYLDPDKKNIENYNFIPFDLYDGKTYSEALDDFPKNDKYDLLLYFPSNFAKSKKVKLIYKKAPSASVQRHIHLAVNESVEMALLKSSNIPLSTYNQIKEKVSMDVVDYKTNKDEGVSKKAMVGFAFGLFVYLFIFLYGVQVMRGVIEEKSSRIVEVIVSSVKPFQLMMGKIIGIMFVGLTQFVIWIVLIFAVTSVVLPLALGDKYSAALQAEGNPTEQVATGVKPMLANQEEAYNTIQDNEILMFLLNEVPWVSLIGLFLFYFIAGYLLYGSLMAAIGAAVDSETDTQQFMLPVSLPLVFAYMISITGIDDPNSAIMVWCSEIPFTSPIVMLVRFAATGGEGLGWQLALSMALIILTFIATTWLAAKIYRTGILMYGKKVTYKELFKWLKY